MGCPHRWRVVRQEVAGEGVVYIGSHDTPNEPCLSALDAATWEVHWRFQTGGAATSLG